MTLVERFIEVADWSDSRKVALIAGTLLPFFFVGEWLGFWVCGQTGFCDVEIMSRYWNAWNISLSAVFFISLFCAWRGWNAGWTVYLLLASQTVFFFGFNHIWGSSSTTFTSMSFVAVFLVGALFGVAWAWIYLAMGVIAIVVLGWLEATGHLSYAPVLTDRTLDAQNHPLWFALNYYVLVVSTTWCLVFASLTISARRLQESRLKQAQILIRRYVPAQVADSILSGHQAEVEKHERRKLTIFFSDLVGFTEIAEEMEPEDLSKLLNEYFSAMTSIAQKHGGTVDELSGDAILVFFGAPHATDDRDHALRAARMALEMQEAVIGLNVKWKAAGIPVSLSVRMGLNTGVVTVGNFGSPERMKYAALGKHVNLAARLQAQCQPGHVLLSYPTWLLIHEQIPCVEKGEVALKGVAKPVAVYEIASNI